MPDMQINRAVLEPLFLRATRKVFPQVICHEKDLAAVHEGFDSRGIPMHITGVAMMDASASRIG